MAADVTRRADTERLVDETLRRFGRVDVLVNSAGVAPRNAPPDWEWERVWDFVMAVNLKGTVLMCRAVVDQMVKQGRGSIVNLSSIYGLVARPREIGTGFDPYVHSKGGVAQLTAAQAGGELAGARHDASWKTVRSQFDKAEAKPIDNIVTQLQNTHQTTALAAVRALAEQFAKDRKVIDSNLSGTSATPGGAQPQPLPSGAQP